MCLLTYVSGRHVPDRRVSFSPKEITGRRMLLLSEGHVAKDRKGIHSFLYRYRLLPSGRMQEPDYAT